MSELIIEFENNINSIVCDEIIEKFNEECNVSKNIFEIPKNDNNWGKIERLLYKQLLVSVNNYKKKLILLNNNIQANEMIDLISQDIYTRNFIVQKLEVNSKDLFCNYKKTHNRYNILNFIFYLNDLQDGGEIVFDNFGIKPQKCKLVLFPQDNKYNFKCKYPKSDNQYIIFGQLCYKNVI